MKRNFMSGTMVSDHIGQRRMQSHNAIKMAQLQNLHFVVDVDIVGFFDNIDHSKLIRQLWGIGIQDRKLIMIIKQMLKAEILFNDIIITPETGTPQGGFYPHFLQMLY